MTTKTKTEKEYFCLYSLELYFYGYFLTVHKFSDTSPFRMRGFVPPGPEYSEKQYLVDPCFFLHPISHFYYLPSPINISNISSLLNPAADGWLKPSKPFTQCSHYLSSRLPLPYLFQTLPPEWDSPKETGVIFHLYLNVPKDPVVLLNTPNPSLSEESQSEVLGFLLSPVIPAPSLTSMLPPTEVPGGS